MTSMKITQCSRPPPHTPCLATSKILPPSWSWMSNFEQTLPNDNQSIKRKHNPRMTIVCCQVRSFLQVGFCFQYQLTDLVWLSINSFCIYLKQISSKLNWTRTMYFFVALYSCVWSCPKISRNAFFKEVFFSTHFAFNLFYFHNFKR